MSDVTKLASLAALAPLALLAAPLGSLAGCVPGASDGPTAAGTLDESPATATATSAIGGPTCPDFGCGANSPTIADGVAFDELAPDGTPDSHGIRIIAGKQGGRPIVLHVDRHTLTAVATDGSGVVFAHSGLVGTVVILAKAGVKYELQINAVDENSLGFWAGNAKEREIVPFYRILVRPPGGQPLTPICKLNVAEAEPVWKPVEHSAIAFVGDRYDPVAKTVRTSCPASRGSTWRAPARRRRSCT